MKGQDGTADYVARSALTKPPAPRTPIVVPYPKASPQNKRLRTELSLFIDEQGIVQRVEIDGPALPPQFEEAARSSFLLGRFTPGEIDGQPVRSRIRVEVIFDDTPLKAPAASN